MRIQHNILAMNAYRNYNNNTSALSKNLEKLSSGYKINRAGDDAAGLAISEKMRAQITGLSAAQKNVKDGISLVKTAEGAMQEIQDMLNRMDYLATQSANGTYDDPVDRDNLNKEMEALKTEIDRIADSANFNGIKLLDGSLDKNAKVGSKDAVEANDDGKFELPKTGDVLAENTILHRTASQPDTTTFSVDLHDVKFTAQKDESMTIKVGDTEIKLTATANSATGLNGAAIADAIGKSTSTTGITVAVTGQTFTAGANAEIKIGGQTFKVNSDSSGRLTFEQKTSPTNAKEEVNGDMAVEISGTGAPAVADVYKTGALTQGDTNGNKAATVTVNYIDKDGKAQSKDVNFDSGNSAANSATALITALGNDTDLKALFTIGGDDNGITFTSKEAGATVKVTGVTVKTAGDDAVAIAAGTQDTAGSDVTKPLTGDWNKQTTAVKSATVADTARLASTVIKLTEDMVADGNVITIGNEEYTFSVAEADKPVAGAASPVGKVYIGDMVGEGNTLDMDKVNERLSMAAAGNKIWTVSADAGKGITLVEKTDATGVSTPEAKAAKLSTREEIAATLGFKIKAQDAVEGTPGKGLTLQIGDTSDKFNQMEVGIGDMHVKAMGKGKATLDGEEIDITKTIADIDIKDQTNAAEAVQVIKNAINYVSSVRGDLGAIQNRLEHTGNNLSVMAENIQDAESTIRDTDVAEEMMGYVKNNILVQSAQAMLAQANQVPQGVLQLLG